jgi:hypothetical protein
VNVLKVFEILSYDFVIWADKVETLSPNQIFIQAFQSFDKIKQMFMILHDHIMIFLLEKSQVMRGNRLTYIFHFQLKNQSCLLFIAMTQS